VKFAFFSILAYRRIFEAVGALPLAGFGIHGEVAVQVEAGQVRALQEPGRLHTRACDMLKGIFFKRFPDFQTPYKSP
jgi:hypothetical protein